jgi:hypothetical protein
MRSKWESESGFYISYKPCTIEQSWRMSGSASSTAAMKFFTKYFRRKFSYTFQEIFVMYWNVI